MKVIYHLFSCITPLFWNHFFIGKIGFEINLSSNDYYTGNKILILMQNIEL